MSKPLDTSTIPSLLSALESGAIKEIHKIATKYGHFHIVPEGKIKEYLDDVYKAVDVVHNIFHDPKDD